PKPSSVLGRSSARAGHVVAGGDHRPGEIVVEVGLVPVVRVVGDRQGGSDLYLWRWEGGLIIGCQRVFLRIWGQHLGSLQFPDVELEAPQSAVNLFGLLKVSRGTARGRRRRGILRCAGWRRSRSGWCGPRRLWRDPRR